VTQSELSRADRVALGKAARAALPLDAHSLLGPSELRADPIELLARQATTRVPELIPIRYGRMLVSPFAFYRGAALIMAADLAGTPTSGFRVQLCGDAHITNFGVFASPERHLVFDVNDFDETLPGPFEWDVKRLAASLEVAGRVNGFRKKDRRTTVLAAVAGYRLAMAAFAKQSNLDVWYARVDLDASLTDLVAPLKPMRALATEHELAKAHTRDSLQALNKLTRIVDGQRRIIDDPPLIVSLRQLLPDADAAELLGGLGRLLRSYARTLPTDRRYLLRQFRLIDVARKVVGVGSVGTRAWILLLEGASNGEPLFLQAKEAQASVLEEFTGASLYKNHGARVVAGQHLMQATSDIFLGWDHDNEFDGVPRDYYIRQLRDWKGAATPESMSPDELAVYARLCGWTLARAHARSGDRIAIASYLGAKDRFDQAIADFAATYADLNAQDHAELQAAAKSGRITASLA
jgi:uncharacterized protein (DUF2252 family)